MQLACEVVHVREPSGIFDEGFLAHDYDDFEREPA